MTSPQKRKGNSAELAVAKWLREWGWVNAERSRAGWQDDRGDIDAALVDRAGQRGSRGDREWNHEGTEDAPA